MKICDQRQNSRCLSLRQLYFFIVFFFVVSRQVTILLRRSVCVSLCCANHCWLAVVSNVVCACTSLPFDMLQYFETIIPLVEKQDEVYFRAGGAAGGL